MEDEGGRRVNKIRVGEGLGPGRDGAVVCGAAGMCVRCRGPASEVRAVLRESPRRQTVIVGAGGEIST